MTKIQTVTGRVGRLSGVAALIIALLPAPAPAQTKVFPYPGDPSWSPWTAASGSALITGALPRHGNGSLALATTGSLFDWGFYLTLSGTNPWGRLADISHLSFEWYRTTLPTTPPGGYFGSWPDAPWLAQTPALRLLLGNQSGLLASELVWEKYYSNGAPTVNDAWQAENLLSQNFWFRTGGTQYAVSDCGTVDTSDPNQAPTGVTPAPAWELLLGNPLGWASGSFANLSAAGACSQFDLADMWVYGISVGVGSNWPDQYQGYADFVRLAFDQQDAVYANFELPETPIPEPATMLLLASGLLGLSGASWLQRRRKRNPKE